jgi:F-box interacting protein
MAPRKKKLSRMALGSNNSTTRRIASRPLSLPLELVEEEILCRLPVKTLLRLRCICKSWKYLISDDPKFAKKHLRMSKILKHHHHLIVNDIGDRFLWDLPLSSVFSKVSKPTVLNIPISNSRHILEICSCDGILCFTYGEEGVVGVRGTTTAVLCNPYLRKYSTLPPLKNHREREVQSSLFSFGYDPFNDVYMVIAISCFKDKNNEVDVYTLGTNYWRSIQDFPCSSRCMYQPGVFVGGTVNWLAYEVSNTSCCRFIVSLDLEKESYQKIHQPDLDKDHWTLGMFRDCLCIFATNGMFLDIWIMKEYGIKESWTKLYNVPYKREQYIYPKTVYISDPKTVYISDDDQVLFSFNDLTNSKFMLVVYNSNNGTVKIPKINHISDMPDPAIYVESLISLPRSRSY